MNDTSKRLRITVKTALTECPEWRCDHVHEGTYTETHGVIESDAHETGKTCYTVFECAPGVWLIWRENSINFLTHVGGNLDPEANHAK